MFWFKILTIAYLPTVLTQASISNFGPYIVHWRTFEVCKGPKGSDCGKVRVDNTENMSDVIFLLDIEKDCPITKARVIVTSRTNNNSSKKTKWNYSLDSPCQHFVLGPILIESFKLKHNCKVNKGNYEVHLNMTATLTNFLGGNFFYGNYTFKIYGHNNKNNFFCVETILEVEQSN